MTAQYLRNLSLVVANPAGQGLELGALRCVFEVRRGDTQTPNSCDVRVYNTSTDTSNRLYSPEFTQLMLRVGYQDQQLQQIFAGSIKQVRKGREDQKNSYVAITAAEGDQAYNYAALAITLAKGATPTDVISGIIKQMATAALATPTGGSGGQVVQPGYLPQLTSNAYQRGRTVYGMCRDELRELVGANDCTWFIQGNQLDVVPLTGYVPEPPILLTPSTGLIGVPEQTQNGLMMRVLINPAIKIGRVVKLDYSDINQYRYGLDVHSVGANLQLARSTTRLSPSGLYYVLRVEHFGDTRGLQWYSDLTCLSVDAEIPTNTLPQAAILPGGAVPRY